MTPTTDEPIDDGKIRVPISLTQFLVSILALMLAIVLGAVCLVAFYLQPIFDRQESADANAACLARANGDVWQAIAGTFSTAPAPSTERADAVARIQDAAKRFDECH